MKIYNEMILKWNEELQSYETIYEDSFDYDGDIIHLMPTCSPDTPVPCGCGGCGTSSCCNCSSQSCSNDGCTSGADHQWDYDYQSWTGSGCTIGYFPNYYWDGTQTEVNWNTYDGTGHTPQTYLSTACGYASCGDAGTCGPCELCVMNHLRKDRWCGNSNCGGCSGSCSNGHYYTYKCVPHSESVGICGGYGSCVVDCHGNITPDNCSDVTTPGCGFIDDCGECVEGGGSPDGWSKDCNGCCANNFVDGNGASCDGNPIPPYQGDGGGLDYCGECNNGEDGVGDNRSCCSDAGVKQPNMSCICDGTADLDGDGLSDTPGTSCNSSYTDCSETYDDCSDCAGGNAADVGCGCDESGTVSYYVDSDGDGLGSGSATSYCAPKGSPNPNSGGSTQVPTYPDECPGGGISGWCTNSSDVHPNCTSNTVDFCNNCYDGDSDMSTFNNCNDCLSDNSCYSEVEYNGTCTGAFSQGTVNVNMDCNGECGGSAVIDDCGVCSGGNSGHEANSDKDCNDECCGGTPNNVGGCGAYENACSTCVEGNTGIDDEDVHGPTLECDGECSGITYTVDYGQDCAGYCEDSNSLDLCGYCYGVNTSYEGFGCYDNVEIYGWTVSTSGGNNSQNQYYDPVELDECPQNWAKDCKGNCQGDAVIDACGICNEGDDINTCSESLSENKCEGDFHIGLDGFDVCGVCFGDGSNCHDCGGISNGDAWTDDCGVCICGENNTYDDTSECIIQYPNCLSDSGKINCSGIHGGPDMDCNLQCSDESPIPGDNYGAYEDNCGVCSEGSTGHVSDFDVDCDGICHNDTPLCSDTECEYGCYYSDSTCGVWMGDDGINGSDECGQCHGDNYNCSDPYNDIGGLWFDYQCGCSGCTNPAANFDPVTHHGNGYDASGLTTIDNGTCEFANSYTFESGMGGIIYNNDIPQVTMEITPGSTLIPTTISIEKLSLDIVPPLPFEDEIYGDNIFRFSSSEDDFLNDGYSVRITLPFNQDYNYPTFIKLDNVEDDSWESFNPTYFGCTGDNIPDGCNPNYPGGYAYVDISVDSLDYILAIANVAGCHQPPFEDTCTPHSIVYGCTDPIAMNYLDINNIQYDVSACIDGVDNGGVSVDTCCLYFDTQCPNGISGGGITDFPAIYIADGQVNNYISIPVTEAHKTLDEAGIVDILNNSFYNENPDLNEDAEPDNSMLTDSTNIFLSFFGYEEDDDQNTSDAIAIYFGDGFWDVIGFKFLEGMSLNIRVDNPVWFKLRGVE